MKADKGKRFEKWMVKPWARQLIVDLTKIDETKKIFPIASEMHSGFYKYARLVEWNEHKVKYKLSTIIFRT